MSLSQLTAGMRLRPPMRWLPDVLPEATPALRALALVALAAGLFGLLAPGIDAGAYVFLAPLALGLAALILVRPEIGLMLVFLTAPLEITYLDVGLRVKPQQIVGLLTMAGFALQFAVGRRKLLRGSGLTRPLFLLLLAFLFSFVMHPQFVSMGIPLFALQVWFIAVIYLVANFVDEPGVLQKCFWMFVVAGVLEALLAVVQVAGFYEKAAPLMSYGSVLNHGRPVGTFSEPDFLAPFLVGSLLLMLPFCGNKRVGGWTPVIYAVVLLLLAASILALVRASWLGLVAGTLVFAGLKLVERGESQRLLFLLKRVATVAISVLVILAFLGFLWPVAFGAIQVRARNIVSIVEPENPHLSRRNEVNEAWHVVREDIITGHGVGTYAITTEYGRHIASGRNNTRAAVVVGSGAPLSLLHDQGIIGLSAFTLLMGVLIWRLLKALRNAVPPQIPYLEGIVAAVVGLTVSSLFNNLYYFGYYWLIIALAAALAEPLWSSTRRSGEAPETAR